jgi:type III pantothenate kinase
MMILELDCGNSLIKWRIMTWGGVLAASGLASSEDQLINDLAALINSRPEACRLVSVRSAEETGHLISLLRTSLGLNSVCAQPARELAGVRNGYEDFSRLGLDRWLAVVGAYQLAQRACLVIDVGTAVTADFIAPDGEHLGGFICPGMPLMRGQLRTHTRKIRYGDDSLTASLYSQCPGRSTIEAVERGCMLMLRGFIREQLEIAHEYWLDDFETFLTGGDAGLVTEQAPGARHVSDLVFTGLALACPLLR